MKNAFRLGKRLYLRPLQSDDLELCRSWLNDPDIHPFLARHRPVSEAEEREWFEGLSKRESDTVFGISLREGERLIGSCGLHQAALPHRNAELGIAIGEAKFHGQGYGKEAMDLLLAYGFDTLNLHRISLSVYAYNPRAIRCYEKCGFRREGARREARWCEGLWWDVLEYGILEEEWRLTNPRETAK
jgi:RimJ/RimL family protein N-acetyltransferase